MIKTFEKENTSALSYDKSVSLFIPGPRSGLWIIISFGEGFASDETSNSNRVDGRLRAPAKHEIGLSILDMLSSRVNTVVGCGAGSRDRIGGPHEPEIDREQRSSHVGDDIGD